MATSARDVIVKGGKDKRRDRDAVPGVSSTNTAVELRVGLG